MVYDTNSDNHPYLRLPVPSLRTLAASTTLDPPAAMWRDIVAAAQTLLNQANDGKVDPFDVHLVVHQAYTDVTIGQVARVMLAWLQIPRK